MGEPRHTLPTAVAAALRRLVLRGPAVRAAPVARVQHQALQDPALLGQEEGAVVAAWLPVRVVQAVAVPVRQGGQPRLAGPIQVGVVVAPMGAPVALAVPVS